jgi:hypothetical protein
MHDNIYSQVDSEKILYRKLSAYSHEHIPLSVYMTVVRDN